MMSADVEKANERLEVHLLGSFRLVFAGQPLEAFPTHAAKLLFAFLVLHRDRRHPRERLAALLWADEPDRDARGKLRRELWRMRRTLTEGTDADFVTVEQNWVGVDERRRLWLDVEAFERRVRAADRLSRGDPDAVPLLEEATELYAGDLLEDEYETWCLVEQDRLRALRLEVLERLIELHIARGAWGHALRSGRELLRHDPLVEHVHRQVMMLHYLAGDRPRALRQFERCEAVLERELSVRPMHRTRELYDALRAEDHDALNRILGLDPDRVPAELPAPGDRKTSGLPRGEILSQLEDVAADLRTAQTRLVRGIRALSLRARRPARPRDQDSSTPSSAPTKPTNA